MPEPSAFEIFQQLERIKRHGRIAPGEVRFLVHTTEETLAARSKELNQKTIAADVFGRDLVNFDARADSIVRTTAAHLRESLLEYYAGVGRTDPVVIELPKGSYVPRFYPRVAVSANATSHLWSARVALEARTVSGYSVAQRHLDAVLRETPDLSVALALKAEACVSQAIHGSRPLPCLQSAEKLANRALEAQTPAWQAWLVRGAVLWALHLNWDAAESAYLKALEVSQGESATHVWYTAFLVGRGRPNEAVLHLQRTVDHFGYCNPTYLGDLAMLQMLARDFAAGRITIEGAIEAAPHYYQHHLNHAVLLEAEGDPGGALQVLDNAPLRLSERPVTWGLRALFAGLNGSRAVARRRITWLTALERTGVYVSPSQIAACHLGAGDHDGAVRSLERGRDERDPLMVWFHAYPFFRHLHGHPAFERLIDSIGTLRY